MQTKLIRSEKGYTLAVVVVFTSVLLVGISEAMINWQKAMQREREEELIFRGKQFIRAIDLWQRKFPGTWPTTIDALLNTSNIRFLRKKWKDPITNSDQWRLIKMNPDGSISGLTIIPSAGPPGANTAGTSSRRRSADASSSIFGQPGSSGNSTDAFTSQNRTDNSLTGQSTPESALGQRGSVSSGSSSSGTPVLGGICGVASTSKKEALKTYNGRSKYNEWEFYYVGQQQLNPQTPPQGPVAGTRGASSPAAGQPTQPPSSPQTVQQPSSPTQSP